MPLAGTAVGISINGKPVYRKGFGLANMELPITLSPSMRMRIHSTTKHFACLAYLLLCKDGKAGIDDELGKVRTSGGPSLRFPRWRDTTQSYYSTATIQSCASDDAPEPRSTGHGERYRLPALPTER